MSEQRRGGPIDTREPIAVLFMQTQAYFGPDARVHQLAMRYLRPDQATVHVACNAARGSAAITALRRTAGITVRPTFFGPSLTGRSAAARALAALQSLGVLVALARLSLYARRQRINVVHVTEKPRDLVYGHLVALACGAQVVTHVHVKMEDWIRPVSRRLMRRCPVLIAVSGFVADSAVAMGYERQRIHIVHNALEVDPDGPDDIDVTSIRAEFGIDDDVAILSIVGRLNPWKGHELLLRALERLARDGTRFHLLVVGEDDPQGTPGGGSWGRRMREMADRAGLAHAVTFTGFRRDAAAIMRASSVFAMPTWEEPFGLVFLEAMAMETPVAAIRSGAAPEVIVDGVTGLLSQPDDPDALAVNIRRLVDDPGLAQAMGRSGRRRVIDEFHPQRLADGLERAWRAALR